MKTDPARVVQYLGHMLEAISRINQYTDATSEAEFSTNALLQDAVIRNFGILGEATRISRLTIRHSGVVIPKFHCAKFTR